MVMLSYTHRCLLNIFLRWHGIDLATCHSEPRFPVHSSTHLFTCVCLFARRCCRSKIFKGGRHICTFVEIFGVEFTRGFPKKVGKRLQSFETLWFQYCVIHREMCSMTLRPIQFAICLTLYTSTSYYTILSIDFAAITLTFPRPQKNRGIWIAWLTCC